MDYKINYDTIEELFHFEPAEIAALIRAHADKLLPLPKICANIPSAGHDEPDPVKVLWAFAGTESSFGRNCTPQHESAYDWGGMYFDADHVRDIQKVYGDWGACSYGPFQILYVAAWELGFRGSPLRLAFPEENIRWAIEYLNRRVIDHPTLPATTLSELPDAYNSGNHVDKNVPKDYIRKWWRHYIEPIPGQLVA